jgi:hypothetical protein
LAKPDFSGTWRFDPGKSALQIPAPDATVFVIEHREPALRITRTHVSGGKSDTFTLDLTTDGKEVALMRGGLRLRARAYWDGEVLVFDSKVARGGVEGTNVVRYALDYDNRWVMEKA